jgi:hypothetical protein
MGISRKIQIKYFEGLVLKYDTIGRYEPCRYVLKTESLCLYYVNNIVQEKAFI